MAASEQTVREVLKVLMDHLEQDQIREVLRALLKVKGNRSFMQTIRALNQAIT